MFRYIRKQMHHSVFNSACEIATQWYSILDKSIRYRYSKNTFLISKTMLVVLCNVFGGQKCKQLIVSLLIGTLLQRAILSAGIVLCTIVFR